MPTSQVKHTPGLLEALRSADATLARIDEIARRHFDAGRGEFYGYWGPVAAGAQHERRRIAAAVAGLAPGAPDEWGAVFAAAPNLLDFAITIRDDLRAIAEHRDLSSTEARWLAGAEGFVAEATGEEAAHA